MKLHKSLGLGSAFVASIALHASGILASAPLAPVVLFDGAPPGVALLGDSFADMAMGAPASPPVTATTTPVAPETTPSDTPDQTPNAMVVPDATPTATGTLALAPTAPTATASPVTTATPPAPTQPTPLSPIETITAIAPPIVHSADATTLRPQRRPADLGQEPPEPPAQQQQAAASGNADQNATLGSSDGQQSGQATAASSGSNAVSNTVANTQAAANYPGQVMRQISRTRRERLNARGVALVSFAISQSGGLASVSIAQSSGNARLDAAAVNHIQRAAPFPAPPAGAQTRFAVEFTPG